MKKNFLTLYSLLFSTFVFTGTLIASSLDAGADESALTSELKAGAGKVKALSQQAGICAATLSQDLHVLLVPKFTIDGASYSASFHVVQAADGSFITTVDGFGATNRNDCDDSDTGILLRPDNNFLLHIPSLMLGADRLWVNLEQIPTSDGTISLKVTAAGGAITDVNGEGSAFLSLTQATVNSIDNTQYQVLESFPGGAEAQVTVTVLANQTYTPTAEEAALAAQLGVQVYGSQLITQFVDEDTYNFKLQYFVPSSALPASAGNVVAMPATNSAPAEEKSGVLIVTETVISKAGKDFVKKLAEMGFGETAKTLLGGLFDVKALTSMGLDHVAWEKRFNAVQDCADNPVVPYAEGERQSIQGTIDSSRTEVRINSGLRVLNKFDAIATSKQAKPLAYPIAVIAKLNDDALKTLSEQEVQVAEKRVSCKKSYQASGGGSATFSGTVCDLAKSFRLHAVAPDGESIAFSYTPGNSQGTFGNLTYVSSFSSGTAHGTGTYTIGPGNNGALSMAQTSFGCVDGLPGGLGCAQHSDTVTLTPIPLCSQ